MSNFSAGQPGITSTRTVTPRKILAGGMAMVLPGGVSVAGSLSRDLGQPVVDQGILRAGMLMGLVTASGLYAPAIVSLLTVLHDTSATAAVVTVGVDAATEIARTGVANISLTGPAVAATAPVNSETKVIDSIDTGAGTITVTVAFTNDYAIGSWLGLGNGAEVPRLIVDSNEGGIGGLEVVDRDKVSVDVDWATPLMGGHLDASQIVNYGSDAVIQEFLKTTLRDTVRALFTFDDDFLNV